MKKLLLCLTILCSLFMTALHAHEHPRLSPSTSAHAKYVKVFPSPEQVYVRSDGIYIHTPHKTLVEVKRLAYEDGVLYAIVKNVEMVAKRGPCGLHAPYHKKPKGCGGCGVLLCPMNCTCFD